MSADQYPEVSDDDAGIVPPQGGRGSEWPKKIRTLTAAELDRLTIDAAGRFYWDGRLVNYEPPTPPKPRGRGKAGGRPAVDALDRSAMDILDRAALELSDRTPVEPLEGSDEQAMADRLVAGDTAATGDGVTAEEQDSHRLDTDEARSSDAAYAIDYDAPAAPVAAEPAAHARSAQRRGGAGSRSGDIPSGRACGANHPRAGRPVATGAHRRSVVRAGVAASGAADRRFGRRGQRLGRRA